MPWISGAIMGGASLLGGVLGGNAAEDAARTSAAAQTESARIAAEAARFRPVGITTAFGSSQFGTDAQGNVNSAGYTLTPEMARQRDLFLSQAGASGLGLVEQAGQAGQGLFNLGRGYLAQSPEQAAQQWLQTQQAALAPDQERQLAAIRNQQQQQGRMGLAVGATDAGGMGASNPQLEAYYNSLQKTNLSLAGDAQAQGRAQTAFGQGLLGGGIDLISQGYNPYKTQFGLGQALETAGQGALDLGVNIGGRTATAGANVGNTLFRGGVGAAETMQRANSYSPFGDALSGLSQNKDLRSGLSNWFGGGGTAGSAVQSEVARLGSSTSNPWSDYNTGANGWGSYGE